MSINEITAKIESLKDELRQFMQEQGVEEYEAGTHIIRYTNMLSRATTATSLPTYSAGTEY